MVFADPTYLRYLWALLPAAVLLWAFARWQTQVLGRLVKPKMQDTVMPGFSRSGFLAPGLLSMAGIGMLIIAMADPRIPEGPRKMKSSGMDIVIALDISRSMEAEDMKPTRLARARQFAAKLSDALAGDRIGLVVFAGHAYTQMPLTVDHGAAHMFLNAVTTDMAPTQGTAIAEALQNAEMLLTASEAVKTREAARAVLLISDGEDHEEHGIEKAKELGRNGILVYTIGVGKPEGAPIPIREDGMTRDYMRDENGKMVLSRLNEDMLRRVAEAGNGNYYHLSVAELEFDKLLAQLQSLSRSEQDITMYESYRSLFQWFVGIGLLLFLVEAGLPMTRRKVTGNR